MLVQHLIAITLRGLITVVGPICLTGKEQPELLPASSLKSA